MGGIAVIVYGLLAYKNYQTFIFSPITAPGPSGLLMIFFGLCAVGGGGLLYLKSWGRWVVGGGAVFVIGSQIIVGYLFNHGQASLRMIQLFEGISLARMAQTLHVLAPAVWALRVFYLAAILVMIFWSRWR